MKRFQTLTLFAIVVLLLSACGSPTTVPPVATQEPEQPIAKDEIVGGIANITINIVPEQGSGAPCTANSIYLVNIDFPSSQPTTVFYKIKLTDASQQVANGTFDGFGASEIRDLLAFSASGIQSLKLRVIGPYTDPASVTVRVSVNRRFWPPVTAACQ
jgi:hypothetical protein